MNNRLISVITTAAVILGLNASLAHAVMINKESGEVPRGVVWEGNTATDTLYIIEPIAYIGNVGLVVTTKSEGGKITENDFADLPIRLSDKNGGETDLYLTLVGTASLTADFIQVGEVWNSGNYSQSRTKSTPYKHLHIWNIARPNLGKVRLTMRPVIFCVPPPGQQTCTIPSGKVSFKPIYIRLYTSKTSWQKGKELTEGGELQGNISFYRSCTFVVENTAFNVSLEKRKTAGLMAASSLNGDLTTSLRISCPDGKPPVEGGNADKIPKGTVKLQLTPQHGLVPGSTFMAKTSHEGLGLVYRLGEKPTSCQSGGKFSTPIVVNQMSVKSWKEQDPITRRQTINWGFCQRDIDAKTKPGAFNTSVDYVLWLE